MELTIKGQVYSFAFNMGFMRDINSRVKMPVDGFPDTKKNLGLNYYIAGVLDRDNEMLVDLLYAANKASGSENRVTQTMLDSYIDEECPEIEELYEKTLEEMGKSNATKKTVADLIQAVEEEKAKQTSQN